MNKGDLITAIAKETGISKKDIEAVLKAFANTIYSEVRKGGKVQLPELGAFRGADRPARMVKNPRTGEDMESPACKLAKFTASKPFKAAINEKKTK